jgi:hypothetical protein
MFHDSKLDFLLTELTNEFITLSDHHTR